ncbi:MAG: putative Ig domain-containing protein, partial [Blastocatellia bacterium]
YSNTLAASGGTTPYTWSITSGSLPTGLTLGASSGTISGTPTGTGISNFTVQVSDANSLSSSKALSLTVNPPAPTITTSSLPNGTQNTAYSNTLAASGGTTPYTWSITSGSLPTGLTLGASSGTISGTPTGTGISNFTVQVSDANSLTATKGLSITINPGGGGGGGAITLVNKTSAGDTSGKSFSSFSAPAANHITGNLLVVICRNGSNFTAQNPPTDTAGDTFVGLTPVSNSSIGVLQMWYAKNIKGNASNVVTCNFPSPDAFVTISVLQYTGADPNNPLDAQATGSGTTSATSGATSALTPAKVGEIIVAGASVDSGGMTFAPGTGFTLRDAAIAATSGDEDESITTTGSVVPSMSWGPSAQHWVMAAASFLPSGTGGGTGSTVSVLTYHNDLARTGQNLNETNLTPANVNTATFGKKFTDPVDGFIYAQPLYMPNLAVSGKGTHNAVFVATENDTVYAFDADASGSPLWQTSLLLPGEQPLAITDYDSTGGCTDLITTTGVTGTPVIDPSTNTLYVIANSKTSSSGPFHQRLHAIDITTGLEKAGS